MKKPAGRTPGTPGRKQVRQSTAPRVNVPRQSQRPVERTGQKRRGHPKR
jgi:hypothetical protein